MLATPRIVEFRILETYEQHLCFEETESCGLNSKGWLIRVGHLGDPVK